MVKAYTNNKYKYRLSEISESN